MKAKDLVISLIASAIAVVVGGMVVQYGWNNFIVRIPNVPPISLQVATGIDLTVTYITGYSTPRSLEKMYENLEGSVRTIVILIIGIWSSLIQLVAMYLVTLFM